MNIPPLVDPLGDLRPEALPEVPPCEKNQTPVLEYSNRSSAWPALEESQLHWNGRLRFLDYLQEDRHSWLYDDQARLQDRETTGLTHPPYHSGFLQPEKPIVAPRSQPFQHNIVHQISQSIGQQGNSKVAPAPFR